MKEVLTIIIGMGACGAAAYLLYLLTVHSFGKKLSSGGRFVFLKVAALLFVLPISKALSPILSLIDSSTPEAAPIAPTVPSAPVTPPQITLPDVPIQAAAPNIVTSPVVPSAPQVSESVPEVAEAAAKISIDIFTVIVAIWLVGIAVCLIWRVFCRLRFEHSVKGLLIPAGEDVMTVYRRCRESMGVTRNIPVYICEKVYTPMIVGAICPKIILPQKTISQKSLEYVFRHELTHYQRGDIFVKMFVSLEAAMHWFNPFVHIFKREITANLELSCDERAGRMLDHDGRKEYCMAILEAVPVKRTADVGLIFGMSGKKKLKKRLDNMLNFKRMKPSQKIIAAITAAVILVSSCVLVAFAIPVDRGNNGDLPDEINGFVNYLKADIPDLHYDETMDRNEFYRQCVPHVLFDIKQIGDYSVYLVGDYVHIDSTQDTDSIYASSFSVAVGKDDDGMRASYPFPSEFEYNGQGEYSLTVSKIPEYLTAYEMEQNGTTYPLIAARYVSTGITAFYTFEYTDDGQKIWMLMGDCSAIGGDTLGVTTVTYGSLEKLDESSLFDATAGVIYTFDLEKALSGSSSDLVHFTAATTFVNSVDLLIAQINQALPELLERYFQYENYTKRQLIDVDFSDTTYDDPDSEYFFCYPVTEQGLTTWQQWLDFLGSVFTDRGVKSALDRTSYLLDIDGRLYCRDVAIIWNVSTDYVLSGIHVMADSIYSIDVWRETYYPDAQVQKYIITSLVLEDTDEGWRIADVYEREATPDDYDPTVGIEVQTEFEANEKAQYLLGLTKEESVEFALENGLVLPDDDDWSEVIYKALRNAAKDPENLNFVGYSYVNTAQVVADVTYIVRWYCGIYTLPTGRPINNGGNWMDVYLESKVIWQGDYDVKRYEYLNELYGVVNELGATGGYDHLCEVKVTRWNGSEYTTEFNLWIVMNDNDELTRLEEHLEKQGYDLENVLFVYDPNYKANDPNFYVEDPSHSTVIYADNRVSRETGHLADNGNVDYGVPGTPKVNVSMVLPEGWSFNGRTASDDLSKVFELGGVFPTEEYSFEKVSHYDLNTEFPASYINDMGRMTTVYEEQISEGLFDYMEHTSTTLFTGEYECYTYVVSRNGWSAYVFFVVNQNFNSSVVQTVLNSIDFREQPDETAKETYSVTSIQTGNSSYDVTLRSFIAPVGHLGKDDYISYDDGVSQMATVSFNVPGWKFYGTGEAYDGDIKMFEYRGVFPTEELDDNYSIGRLGFIEKVYSEEMSKGLYDYKAHVNFRAYTGKGHEDFERYTYIVSRNGYSVFFSFEVNENYDEAVVEAVLRSVKIQPQSVVEAVMEIYYVALDWQKKGKYEVNELLPSKVKGHIEIVVGNVDDEKALTDELLSMGYDRALFTTSIVEEPLPTNNPMSSVSRRYDNISVRLYLTDNNGFTIDRYLSDEDANYFLGELAALDFGKADAGSPMIGGTEWFFIIENGDDTHYLSFNGRCVTVHTDASFSLEDRANMRCYEFDVHSGIYEAVNKLIGAYSSVMKTSFDYKYSYNQALIELLKGWSQSKEYSISSIGSSTNGAVNVEVDSKATRDALLERLVSMGYRESDVNITTKYPF